MFLNKLNVDEIKTSSLCKHFILDGLNEILDYLGANIKTEHKEKILAIIHWYYREAFNAPY